MSLPYTQLTDEEKPTSTLATPLLFTPTVPTPNPRTSRAKRVGIALVVGAALTALTYGIVQLVSDGDGCSHHGMHPPQAGSSASGLTGVEDMHPLHAFPHIPVHFTPTHPHHPSFHLTPQHKTSAEADMVVLNDPDHPVNPAIINALASAKLRALRASGYNIDEMHVAIVPQNKQHPLTLQQAMDVGMKAIEKGRMWANGAGGRMQRMVGRMREGLREMRERAVRLLKGLFERGFFGHGSHKRELGE